MYTVNRRRTPMTNVRWRLERAMVCQLMRECEEKPDSSANSRYYWRIRFKVSSLFQHGSILTEVPAEEESEIEYPGYSDDMRDSRNLGLYSKSHSIAVGTL